MKTRLTLIFTLLLLCLGTGTALAQEDPCGDETGAAYGLCNAYVAMDCQTDNPDASESACSRVADKFEQITGRDLPSKFVSCPCLSIPEFSASLANGISCQANHPTFGAYLQLPDDAFIYSAAVECGYFDGFAQVLTENVTAQENTACRNVIFAASDLGLTCN
jgi:hypothetical protein